MAQNWHKSFALVRVLVFSCGQYHQEAAGLQTIIGIFGFIQTPQIRIFRDQSIVQYRPKVHAMTPNQIRQPTISNIDESLDVNVGMTPTTRGKR